MGIQLDFMITSEYCKAAEKIEKEPREGRTLELETIRYPVQIEGKKVCESASQLVNVHY